MWEEACVLGSLSPPAAAEETHGPGSSCVWHVNGGERMPFPPIPMEEQGQEGAVHVEHWVLVLRAVLHRASWIPSE